MTHAKQGAAFDADKFREAYPDGIENNYWSVARNWIIEAALPDKAHILEIGCGRGVVVSYLLSRGGNAWGSELASPPLLAGTEVWSAWDDHFEHRRRYTRELLSAHLKEAGLCPIKMRYFFHALYVAALLIRLLGLKRRTHLPPPGNPTLHRLLAYCLWAESRMLMPIGFLPGLSLLAVARRR
jgi:hypothetical protein